MEECYTQRVWNLPPAVEDRDEVFSASGREDAGYSLWKSNRSLWRKLLYFYSLRASADGLASLMSMKT